MAWPWEVWSQARVMAHADRMRLPCRLDMMLDLFDVELDGHTLLLDQRELGLVQARLDQLYACWSSPNSAQLWAAVVEVLGRDPRA